MLKTRHRLLVWWIFIVYQHLYVIFILYFMKTLQENQNWKLLSSKEKNKNDIYIYTWGLCRFYSVAYFLFSKRLKKKKAKKYCQKNCKARCLWKIILSKIKLYTNNTRIILCYHHPNLLLPRHWLCKIKIQSSLPKNFPAITNTSDLANHITTLII